MSDATLVKVAEAMKAEVVAGQLASAFPGHTFTPIRSYATFADTVTEQDGLRVDLVPFKYDISTLASRDRIGYDCSVDIFVRKKFNATTDRTGTSNGNKNDIKTEEIDKLVRLTQDFNEFFVKRRLTTLPGSSWRSSSIVSAYSRNHLNASNMFLGVVRAVFYAPEDSPR